MEIKAYASSSRGNCYTINDGVTIIMIECGIPHSVILRCLKEDYIKINYVLVTHEHRDHSLDVKQLLPSKVILSSKGTLDALGITGYPIEAHRCYRINTFDVYPFKTQHDAVDPLGFVIKSNVSNETILFATDTFYLKQNFENIKFDYVMIECNYDKKILDYNYRNKNITKQQYDRLVFSHFEISNVKKFLLSLNKEKLKGIYLLHLSATNGIDTQFLDEIKALMGIPTYVCAKFNEKGETINYGRQENV